MPKPQQKRDLLWLRQTSSFTASRIILTANNFRIFDHLVSPGKTAQALTKKISADERATELLLDSLVAIGLLQKSKDLYKNSPLTSRYLISGKPEYQGDILRHYSNLWDNWSGLDTVLKTGKPNRKSHDHEAFILGMHNLALLKVKKVLAHLDLKGVKRVLDLGGGPGTYSMALAIKGKEVTIMDFPETLKIAKRLFDKAGISKKITLLSGDFMSDEMGRGYDLIFISQILHAYDDEGCISLLKKCFQSLNPGGRVVVQEFTLDESKTSPFHGAIFAINMLVNTPGGRTYTPKEMSSWMKKTGFRDIKTTFLEETVLVEGQKR
jgi:2-polyprenyl-3-methyl-5-hydroxy-6-metoxy-1,4-benzoquinol methylase